LWLICLRGNRERGGKDVCRMVTLRDARSLIAVGMYLLPTTLSMFAPDVSKASNRARRHFTILGVVQQTRCWTPPTHTQTHAHTSQTFCAPTRHTAFCGRHPLRMGNDLQRLGKAFPSSRTSAW